MAWRAVSTYWGWLVGCILYWGSGLPCAAGPAHLSEAATISLLTCAPGPDAYALFGHSALRVADPALGLDRVYNYGTFDFLTPNFYGRFLRGDLRYFLSTSTFSEFCQAYSQEQRAVSEQVLALQPAERQRIFARLEATLHSSAKYYRYQFFADNCSTRLFDLVGGSLDAPLHLDSARVGAGATYRRLLAPYLAASPWVKVGMNVGLGLPADRRIWFRQRLFLPLELQQALTHATRHARPLVAQHRFVVAARGGTPERPAFTPLGLLLGWAGASVLLWQWPGCPPWLSCLTTRLLLGTVGLLGCVLTGLSFGSLHTPVQANYQLLWLLPSHLVLAVARPRAWWRYYAAIALALLVVGGLGAAALGYVQLVPEVAVLLALLLAHLVRLCLGSAPRLNLS